MSTDRSTLGIANPYALTEAVLGKQVDWRRVDNPIALIESTLGLPWAELIEPSSGSVLFAGLVPDGGGRLRKIADAERKDDLERRLKVHNNFKASAALGADAASRRFALVLEKLNGAADNVVWLDLGNFFTDSAEGGDPVQGAVGDCYFIAALSAVAWSMPALIRYFPRGKASDGADVDTVVFSPGYYHGTGNQTSVLLTECTPTQNGNPLYARSSDPGEIWPAVYEKAFAKWRNQTTSDEPDILALGGGDCLEATRAITSNNYHLDAFPTEGVSADDVVQHIRQHTRGARTLHPMTAWTYSSADAFPNDGVARNYDRSGIVFNHCYTIYGWAVQNGVTHVILRNPWGYHEATRGDVAQGSALGVALNTGGVFGLPVEVFRRYFQGFGVVYP